MLLQILIVPCLAEAVQIDENYWRITTQNIREIKYLQNERNKLASRNAELKAELANMPQKTYPDWLSFWSGVGAYYIIDSMIHAIINHYR